MSEELLLSSTMQFSSLHVQVNSEPCFNLYMVNSAFLESCKLEVYGVAYSVYIVGSSLCATLLKVCSPPYAAFGTLETED